MKYLKSDEPINNGNSKTTRLNVAGEVAIICLICENLGHTTKIGFHLSNAQKAVLNKQ